MDKSAQFLIQIFPDDAKIIQRAVAQFNSTILSGEDRKKLREKAEYKKLKFTYETLLVGYKIDPDSLDDTVCRVISSIGPETDFDELLAKYTESFKKIISASTF